ncbi:hypothetical protein SAMN04489708_11316 [Paracidovorax cattleyae]|uniref:Uncharacterized protein n=1 Tax=Paracidovorax cattleyae TaxID=80868 RepID=A0A1H0SQG2_9BURK|nr:hypothetical protein SAMN04489708_11316 [Paracidovorax cattleyae]
MRRRRGRAGTAAALPVGAQFPDLHRHAGEVARARDGGGMRTLDALRAGIDGQRVPRGDRDLGIAAGQDGRGCLRDVHGDLPLVAGRLALERTGRVAVEAGLPGGGVGDLRADVEVLTAVAHAGDAEGGVDGCAHDARIRARADGGRRAVFHGNPLLLAVPAAGRSLVCRCLRTRRNGRGAAVPLCGCAWPEVSGFHRTPPGPPSTRPDGWAWPVGCAP